MRTLALPAIHRSREIERVVNGMPTSDGAGVKLTRVLTHDLQRRLDPFLMLDAFKSDQADDYIAGFPDHPHRGFETVTYMLAGRMRHRDNAGNEGLLQNGGVQWMTAGRGIVHSELPEQEDGLMEGFQLWVNLPGRNKMTDPGYRDIPATDIPEFALEGDGALKLIAGKLGDAEGAVTRPDTEPLYLDLAIPAGGEYRVAIPAGHNAFVYVYRGALTVGDLDRPVRVQQMGVLGNDGDGVWLKSDVDTRLILVAGKPLNEPIAQWGPFVMNTREEVQQAVYDFNAGRF
ncbi:pirin family protein [Chitiniphilus eburneus]|uniref:Pirin family protein n=1 Tax=Chitiniphilus eburneus TaxID=2571148 RepID=A0A4U0PSP9_9NEIS|nr:pirin family protein [Chitiniphilus eburneus]TJZ71050.1 pirin family protein [Chitiniphilus eburneus]